MLIRINRPISARLFELSRNNFADLFADPSQAGRTFSTKKQTPLASAKDERKFYERNFEPDIASNDCGLGRIRIYSAQNKS
jgi:hypothetical protein